MNAKKLVILAGRANKSGNSADATEIIGTSWDNILDGIKEDDLNKILADADVIRVIYRSLLPGFDEIVSNICASLPEDGRLRQLFFDFTGVHALDAGALAHTLTGLSYLKDKFSMTLEVCPDAAAGSGSSSIAIIEQLQKASAEGLPLQLKI